MSIGCGFSTQTRIEFVAGTEIFHEGQDAYAAFLTPERQVEVRKHTDNGHKAMTTVMCWARWHCLTATYVPPMCLL